MGAKYLPTDRDLKAGRRFLRKQRSLTKLKQAAAVPSVAKSVPPSPKTAPAPGH